LTTIRRRFGYNAREKIYRREKILDGLVLHDWLAGLGFGRNETAEILAFGYAQARMTDVNNSVCNLIRMNPRPSVR
jgi:hypothetical protein